MQIVVNTRLLLKNKLYGIGWFSYQSLKRITSKHKNVHFVFLFDRVYDPEFVFSDNITPLIISPQARHPVLYYIWFEHSVRSILNKLKPDLFLSPDGMLSLGAKCKQLPVIHDINFKHHPEDLPFLTRKYYNHYFPKFARKAQRIATVSEYSKNDIAQSYQIDPSKIDVVYNGINEIFHPLSEEEKKQVKQRYTAGEDYFLFVGSIHPRKNPIRLLQAFEQFKQETGSTMKMVFAGPFFWGKKEVQQQLGNMKSKKDVVFTGSLNSQELNRVFASAFCLTFVPYFEGFGIPLVEAMQCEVPVITSELTSMPEVAGNAALLIDPYQVAEIKNAMCLIYSDARLRQDLVEEGKLRKHHFSWDKTADLLWESMEKAIKE